ncbi:MAG: hypothetical protein DHS20C18_31620 [Saprospiraceae bacterium]|nr:MAG: hypothetical protein DHS20C18_31620 [Saprospiraceae bacterium]
MRALKINHLAVFVIVVLGQLIPMGWYGLFAQKWMSLNKLTMDTIEANQSATPYIVSIIASVILAYILAWLFVRMKIESPMDGLVTGLAIGFGFTFMPTMVHNFFSFRPYELTWIDGGANLIIYAVAGLILGSWRKYA